MRDECVREGRGDCWSEQQRCQMLILHSLDSKLRSRSVLQNQVVTVTLIGVMAQLFQLLVCHQGRLG